jgi:hypothetical protein
MNGGMEDRGQGRKTMEGRNSSTSVCMEFLPCPRHHVLVGTCESVHLIPMEAYVADIGLALLTANKADVGDRAKIRI